MDGRGRRARTRPTGRETLPVTLRAAEGAVDADTLRGIAERAAALGVAPHDELVAGGLMAPEAYAMTLAAALGTGYARRLEPPDDLDPFCGRHPREVARLGLMAAGRRADGLAIAVDCRGPHLARLADGLVERPEAAERVVLMSSQGFTDTIAQAGGETLAREAASCVARVHPGLAARDGLMRWQRLGLIGAAMLAAFGAAIAPYTSLLALLALSTAFFLAVSGLRLLAAVVTAATGDPPVAAAPSDAELPVYTVLAPIYREANILPRLVAALEAIDYPRAKLDAKLIVEADDEATRAALRRTCLPAWCEVVTVPPGRPRTKPRALCFALPLARGELATVFDAEDRPEPDQLRRAAATFHHAPRELACLQARLAWYNWTDNWLTRQFAIEYASLFDVLLPALDRLGLAFPLGGTSNHFRGLR